MIVQASPGCVLTQASATTPSAVPAQHHHLRAMHLLQKHRPRLRRDAVQRRLQHTPVGGHGVRVVAHMVAQVHTVVRRLAAARVVHSTCTWAVQATAAATSRGESALMRASVSGAWHTQGHSGPA
jgi:hypothetical protein